MDNHQKDIERYLDGDMTDSELLAFEQQLNTDNALALAYESELMARRVITEAGRLELKNTLENYDVEMEQVDSVSPKEVKVMPLWMKRALPIAAMFIIFVGVFRVLQDKSMTTSEVYDTYFETYEAPSAMRNADGNDLLNWETASRLYRDRKYSEAIPYFTKAGEEVPEYLPEFYKGMSNLNLDGPYYQRAIEAFDLVLQTDNDYRQQAQWYKALALLKINKKDEALVIFESIVESKSFHYEQAEKILDLRIELKE